MHEYEIFIEDINPCGGEQYSKKTLIEAEAASDSTTGGDWWSGLFGSSSSSSSTETGTEQGTAGSGDSSQKPLTDWWSSLLS